MRYHRIWWRQAPSQSRSRDTVRRHRPDFGMTGNEACQPRHSLPTLPDLLGASIHYSRSENIEKSSVSTRNASIAPSLILIMKELPGNSSRCIYLHQQFCQ